MPSKVNFFKSISNGIKTCVTLDCSIVVGGDFNVTYPDLDRSGGIKKKKDSVKNLEDICLEQDLVDIWRIRNPTLRKAFYVATKISYHSKTVRLLVGK